VSRDTKRKRKSSVSAISFFKPRPFEKGRGLVKRLKPLLKDKKGLGMLVKKIVSLLTKKLQGSACKKSMQACLQKMHGGSLQKHFSVF
jgi:hypothetical protein